WSGIRAGAILRLALEKVPFVIMAAMVGVITLNLQRDLGTVSGIRFSIRAENAIVSYFAYLEKALWPAKLAVLYPHPKSFLSGFRVGIAALVLLAISVAVISAFRRYKYLGVGWLWFLGALVPVIGIIQAGSQSMADRYAYIPLIGIFVVVAWGLGDLVEKYKRARDYVIVGAVGVLFAFAIVTRVQLNYWSSSLALWQHAQEVTENNYVAYNNLGEALWSRGYFEAAAPLFSKSVQVYPYFPNAQLNLGMVLVQNGQIDEGIEHFTTALELDSRSVDGYNKLGAALGRKGQSDEA